LILVKTRHQNWAYLKLSVLKGMSLKRSSP